MNQEDKEMLKKKILGVFAGIAIGDGLGMPVETMTAQEIAEKYGRITTYIKPTGHKWYDGFWSGQWTDDTQLSLAVAESLIACNGEINLDDLAKRHIEAFDECSIGWGKGTKTAIAKLKSGDGWIHSGTEGSSGNGVAMKVSPLGLKITADYVKINSDGWDAADYFKISKVRWKTMRSEEKFKLHANNLIGKTLSLSRMTHDSAMAAASAIAQIQAICYTVNANKKYDFNYDFILGIIHLSRFCEGLMSSDKSKAKLSIRMYELYNLDLRMSVNDLAAHFNGAGSYVYDSLPFCYAAFLRGKDSIETLYDVVNAGGDTDTNGSIVGALLGAYNGIDIFPAELLRGIWQRGRVFEVAEKFWRMFFSNL